MSTDAMATAFTTARGILANVTPDQWDEATPCTSWDVRALVNHMISAPRWATSVVKGKAVPGEEDFADGDFLASYDQSADAAIEAFNVPGVEEMSLTLPFGEFAGSFLMGMITGDQFTHAWDLARATGQSTDLDPELANGILTMVTASVGDEMRGEDGAAPFGPRREAPAGAPAADQLAAYLGRTVA